MDKRFAIVIAAGIIVAASAVFAVLDDRPGDSATRLSYTDSNKDLQLLLADQSIMMSSPLRLNGISIEKYCTFFSSDEVQDTITYCTSTELLDPGGGFLGNIQMVGSTSTPRYVIVAIQTDSDVSQSDSLKTVFGTAVDTLVCDCWEERSPGGFATVSQWVDAVGEMHAGGGSSTTKSDISGMAEGHMLLEVTTNKEGYLWKLVIS